MKRIANTTTIQPSTPETQTAKRVIAANAKPLSNYYGLSGSKGHWRKNGVWCMFWCMLVPYLFGKCGVYLDAGQAPDSVL